MRSWGFGGVGRQRGWLKGKQPRQGGGLDPRSALLLLRGSLLPVHGHALPRLRAPEEGEVPGQARARVHPELQGAASRF